MASTSNLLWKMPLLADLGLRLMSGTGLGYAASNNCRPG